MGPTAIRRAYDKKALKITPYLTPIIVAYLSSTSAMANVVCQNTPANGSTPALTECAAHTAGAPSTTASISVTTPHDLVIDANVAPAGLANAVAGPITMGSATTPFAVQVVYDGAPTTAEPSSVTVRGDVTIKGGTVAAEGSRAIWFATDSARAGDSTISIGSGAKLSAGTAQQTGLVRAVHMDLGPATGNGLINIEQSATINADSLTSNQRNFGVVGQIGGNMTINNGAIVTVTSHGTSANQGSTGVQASSNVIGGNVVATNSGTITVSNAGFAVNAGGLVAQNLATGLTASNTIASATNSGSITVTANVADNANLLKGGIAADAGSNAGSLGTASIVNTGNVTAAGDNLNGVIARSGAGAVNVTLQSGAVKGGSSLGAGAHLLSSGTSTLRIEAAATLTADSGVAIRNGLAVAGGSDAGNGSINVTSLGTVTGDALLGADDDSFDLDGGTYTGDIHLGNGDNRYGQSAGTLSGDVIALEGDDIANWTGGVINGGFSLGDGSDTLTISTNNISSADFTGADGGDDSGVADEMIDTLNLVNLTFSEDGTRFTNWEDINLSNTSLTLTGNGTLGASTDAGHGIFVDDTSAITVQDNFNLGGNLTLNGGALNFAPTPLSAQDVTVLGSVVNNGGLINMSNGAASTTLNVEGDYTSGGGVIRIDANLTGQGENVSSTDKITVAGNSFSIAPDKISVTNLNIDSPTGSEILQVVQVNGETSEAIFELDGRVAKGGYEYLLNKHADDGSWYLESALIPGPNPEPETPIYRPETGTYDANLDAARSMFMLGWRDRVGAAQVGEEGRRPAWLRISGMDNKFGHARGTIDTKSDTYAIQGGIDIVRSQDSQDFVIGLMGGYGWSESNSLSLISGYGSRGRVDGFNVGGYLTWLPNGEGNRGFYLDSWVTYSKFNADVRGQLLSREEYKMSGWTASVEAGYSFNLSSGDKSSFWLEPQAQLVWGDINVHDFTEQTGTDISETSHDLTSRIGLRATIQGAPNDRGHFGSFYVQADWLRAWDRTRVNMGGFTLEDWSRDTVRATAGYEQRLSDGFRARVGVDYRNGRRLESIGGFVGVNVQF